MYEVAPRNTFLYVDIKIYTTLFKLLSRIFQQRKSNLKLDLEKYCNIVVLYNILTHLGKVR